MKSMVSFRRMEDGTREDYLLLDKSEREYAVALPDHVLGALRKLDHSLEGYPVSRLGHSLQAATRAHADGADDELLVAALIHDIGDELAPYNHAEIAAGILRPYVRPEVTWIVEQHGLVQSYYYAHHLGGNRNARDRLLPLFLRPAHEVARQDDTGSHAANDQAGEGIDVRANAEFHFRVDDHGERAGSRA